MPYYQGDYYQGGIPALALKAARLLLPKAAKFLFGIGKKGVALAVRNPVSTAVVASAAIPAIRAMTGGGRPSYGGGDGIPQGYHFNKALKRYEVASSQGRNVQDPRNENRVVNEIVRNRSANPLNPRALKRAFRRLKSAQKWARKLVQVQAKVKIRRKK